MAAIAPYTYRARIVRVVDGDTFTADIDLGFGMWLHAQSFRLLGVNAREHDQPGGPEASAHLASILVTGLQVLLSSVKPDKYGGRYDAVVCLQDGRDLAQMLIADQWAAAWDGGGLKLVPPWPRPQSAVS